MRSIIYQIIEILTQTIEHHCTKDYSIPPKEITHSLLGVRKENNHFKTAKIFFYKNSLAKHGSFTLLQTGYPGLVFDNG